MDETLVHCVVHNIAEAHHIVEIALNKDQKIEVGINIRPYARKCLKELSKYYELIIFTASHSNYANPIIDLLDPDHTLFSKRLFSNNCIYASPKIPIKDLRILNCDLKQTITVDKYIHSFAFQLDNGIPIVPYNNNKNDRILLKVKDYLISLITLRNVRLVNRETFCLSELENFDLSHFLKSHKSNKGKIEDTKNVEFEEIKDFGSKNRKKDKKKCLSIIQNNDFISDPFNIGKKTHEMVKGKLSKVNNISKPSNFASKYTINDTAYGVI